MKLPRRLPLVTDVLSPVASRLTGYVSRLSMCLDHPQAAPGAEEDASSKLWLYRSVLTQQTDANSGLVGPIIVTRRDVAKADGSPNDVDMEFVTLFQVPVPAHAVQTTLRECCQQG